MGRPRAFGGAAAVLAAAGLAVGTGDVGLTQPWRVATMLGLGFLAALTLSTIAPAIALKEAGMGCLLFYPAVFLVVVTAWLTVVDHEVHHGQWVAVTVQEKQCVPIDNGCTKEFRVTSKATEQDYGWLACDAAELSPGVTTRVHADPAGRQQANLEACAHTSGVWTLWWYVVLGVYVLLAGGLFAMSSKW